jgi:hypothetical protein
LVALDRAAAGQHHDDAGKLGARILLRLRAVEAPLDARPCILESVAQNGEFSIYSKSGRRGSPGTRAR